MLRRPRGFHVHVAEIICWQSVNARRELEVVKVRADVLVLTHLRIQAVLHEEVDLDVEGPVYEDAMLEIIKDAIHWGGFDSQCLVCQHRIAMMFDACPDLKVFR